jgi:hypothetical protein
MDLAVVEDQGGADDLSMPDLKGPSCGQIVLCLFKCGFTNLTCDQMCTAGAQPTAIQESTALGLCTAQNCLSTLTGSADAGAAGMLAVIGCIEKACPMQVNSCEDLPFVAPTM